MKKKIKILAVILARAGSKGVYQKNIRDFYNIESLWGDAQQICFK